MGVNRRSVLALLIGGAAGTLATPIPWKLTDDASIWTQNWPWIPRVNRGHAVDKPAIMKLGAPQPVLVPTVNGQPVTAKGNPDNPLSGRGINAMAAAGVQMLYSPARAKGPMATGGSSLSWDDALSQLAQKLSAAGSSVAFVSGDPTGSCNEVFSAFLAALGSQDCYQMPCEHQLAAKAWHGLMGGEGHPGFDLANADAVLILGPDMFDSWGLPSVNGQAYAASHPSAEEAQGTWIYVGPLEGRTGAACDKAYRIKAGSEAAFAMGLANQLLAMGAASDVQGMAEFADLAAGFAPSQVEAATGVPAKELTEIARTLLSASKPLVVPGSLISQGGSPAAWMAGMGLNLLLGNVGREGGVRSIPETDPVVQGAMPRPQLMQNDLVAYLMDVEAGKKPVPEVLMVYDANPAYALPRAARFREVLAKVPFLISFSPFMDETAAMAHLVLPGALSLEQFEDMETPYGSSVASYNAAAPLMAPAVDARPAGDVILAVAKALGQDLGFESMEGVIEAKAGAVGADTGSLAEGQAWTSDETLGEGNLSLDAAALKAALAEQAGEGLILQPLYQLNVGSAAVATPPFNLPTIRDSELLGHSLFVAMSKATADKAGLRQGQNVTVSSPAGEIKARVTLDETIAEGVVTAPLGLGHTAWDDFTRDKGANVYEVLDVKVEPGTGAPVWNAVRVQIA